jgi:hypothetical protein
LKTQDYWKRLAFGANRPSRYREDALRSPNPEEDDDRTIGEDKWMQRLTTLANARSLAARTATAIANGGPMR